MLYQVVTKIQWYFVGPHARTKDGEVWVWQMREERENISDQEEDNLQADMFIIVFATVHNLHHLSRAEAWCGDGTFSVCPSLFYQLYTIYVEVYWANCTFGFQPAAFQIQKILSVYVATTQKSDAREMN